MTTVYSCFNLHQHNWFTLSSDQLQLVRLLHLVHAMAGDQDHLKQFLNVLHGPYRPDGTFDGRSHSREMYVALYHRPGMDVPVGAVVRGNWLVPVELAGPAQQPHPPGLLPVLRQPGEPALLRGDGGVDVPGFQAEQFHLDGRVDSSGKLLIN